MISVRITIMAVVIFFIPLMSAAQAIDTSKCRTCRSRPLCVDCIASKHNDTAKAVLLENWSDFEGYNLEPRLKADGLPNVMAIRFDGIGCVYPAFIDDNRLKKIFLHDNVILGGFRRYSFIMVMHQYPDILELHYPQLKGKLDALKKIAAAPVNYDLETEYTHCLLFRKEWNKLFLPEIVQRARDTIKNKQITHCVYFMPGYNVPYSLAQLHGNHVFSDYARNLPPGAKADNILFIRVFWPTNSQKKNNFTAEHCNIDNQLKTPNKVLYNFITNRAYCAGLSLRHFINELPDTITMALVSHSFGATLNSALVLDPISKMRQPYIFRDSLLIEAYKNEPPLKQTCYLFLSAPGIPGRSNFELMNAARNAHHFFYIGYNNKDRILRKQPFLFELPAFVTNAGYGNATTLGCNYWGEIKKVKKKVRKELKMESNFYFKASSRRFVHDYFCVRRQRGFQEHFAKFVRESWTRDQNISD